MKRSKEVEIKARVTAKMRKQLEAIANERGEALSVIVREAVSEYLSKRNLVAPAVLKKTSSG
jgi:hypothetical protein